MTDNIISQAGDIALMEREIAQIDEMRKQRQRVLRDLLDEKLSDDNHLLVTRGEMGLSETWLGNGSLQWINDNVRLFTSLPLFQEKVDKETGAFIPDEATVEELKQRAPNWSRQPILVNYLLRHKSRLFPPILVIAEEPWVNKQDAPEWGEDGRATKTSIAVELLNTKGNVGVLDVRGATVYVVDGSHRVMGIQGVIELLRTGRLTIKRKDGGITGRSRTQDDLFADLGVSRSAVAGLGSETMGIEFIPAVIKGETREEARIRVRSVFVHVNKTAQPPTAGEQVLLDEDDGFSIVARKIALGHRLFNKDAPGDRINWRSSALPSGSKWLTTGKTLRDFVFEYLRGNSKYVKWGAGSKEIPMRPEEEDLEEATRELNELFDRIADLPSFGEILRTSDVDTWREFGDHRDPENRNRGHLLMRPVGQLILARAVGHLHMDDNTGDHPRMSLDQVFAKLKKYDEAGGFEGVDSPKSPWYGITYDPIHAKMIMQKSNRELAEDLLMHLVRGSSGADYEGLLARFQEIRTFSDDQDNLIAYDHDGKNVGDPGKIRLPEMI